MGLTAFSTSCLYGSPFELAAEEPDLDNDNGGNSSTLFKSNLRLEPRRRPTSCHSGPPATCHSAGMSSRFFIVLIGDRNFGAFRWRGGEGVVGEFVGGFVGREEEAFGVDEKPDASMVDELVGSILSTKIDG